MYECVDDTWINSCCGTGYTCTKISRWWHQCARVDSAGAESVGPLTMIPDFQACGGTDTSSTSLAVDPVDGPWNSTICSPGFVCVRFDPHFWQCTSFPYINTKPSSSASGGVQTEAADTIPLGDASCL